MLTPIDIQNHSLKTAVRGYSKKETDDFLEEILQGYEVLYKENRELKDKITSLSEGIQYYKQMETTLQKALVLAEKTSTETQEAAKSKADAMTSEAQTKAEAMTSEAQAKADAVLKEAQAEAEALRKETQAYSEITKAKANRELEETRNHVRKLVQSYENYRLQFKKLAESQIEMLESEHYSIFAPELSEMLDDAPDADAVMEAENMVAINHVDLEEETVDVERRDLEQETSADIPKDIVKEDADVSQNDWMEENTAEEDLAEEAVDGSQEDFGQESTADSPKARENDIVSDSQKEDLEQETDAVDQKKLEEDMFAINQKALAGMLSREVSGYVDDDKESEEPENAASDGEVTGQTGKSAGETEESVWENTIPKVEDYEPVETKTVSPNPKEDSPFTFIDTE